MHAWEDACPEAEYRACMEAQYSAAASMEAKDSKYACMHTHMHKTLTDTYELTHTCWHHAGRCVVCGDARVEVIIHKACQPLFDDDAAGEDSGFFESVRERGAEGEGENKGECGGTGSREDVVLHEATRVQADLPACEGTCVDKGSEESELEYPELLRGCEASARLRVCECVRAPASLRRASTDQGLLCDVSVCV